MNLKVLLETLQSGRWVEILSMQPIELFVDILLREHKHVEFLTFHEIWAFGNLLDKHAQEVAPFLQKLITIIAKTLFIRECWYVQTRQSLNEAVP